MIVYRLGRKEYARDLSGEGSRLYGGRWNHIGTPCIYTSITASLSLCEYLVNLPSNLLPIDLVIIQLEIDADLIEAINEKDLPKNWKAIPTPTSNQDFGDKLLSNRNLIGFSIPSVIIPIERNIILNPLSKGFEMEVSIKQIDDFGIDGRFKK